MALELRRCLACGAPLEGSVCSYCESVHHDPNAMPKETECELYVDNKVYMTIPIATEVYTANELRKMAGLTEEQSMVTNCLLRKHDNKGGIND